MSQADREELRAKHIATASLREIARAVAIATKYRCSTDRAREIKKYIIEHPDPVAAVQ